MGALQGVGAEAETGSGLLRPWACLVFLPPKGGGKHPHPSGGLDKQRGKGFFFQDSGLVLMSLNPIIFAKDCSLILKFWFRLAGLGKGKIFYEQILEFGLVRQGQVGCPGGLGFQLFA